MIDRPLILLGAPGSGKGTLAGVLTRYWRTPVIATGDLLRAQAAGDGPLAGKLRAEIESGHLVSEQLVNQAVANRLTDPECRAGFILDGYPRTVSQAQFLTTLLHRLHLPTPAVIELAVPAKVVCTRMLGRMQCIVCGATYNVQDHPPAHPGFCDHDGVALTKRADDEITTILGRLQVYDETIAPLSDYCETQWEHHIVNGNQPLGKIVDEVQKLLTRSTRNVHSRAHAAGVSRAVYGA